MANPKHNGRENRDEKKKKIKAVALLRAETPPTKSRVCHRRNMIGVLVHYGRAGEPWIACELFATTAGLLLLQFRSLLNQVLKLGFLFAKFFFRFSERSLSAVQ